MGFIPDGVMLRYLGGFANTRPKRSVHWYMVFEASRLVVRNDDTGTFGMGRLQEVRAEPYSRIRLEIEPTGSSRANLAAIAAFGVLGLSARSSTTLVSVKLPDGHVFFESTMDMARWKAYLNPLLSSSPAAQKAIQLGPAPAPPAGPDLLGQIQQLGELKDRGLLTDAEFAAKKAELLSRL